MLRCRGILLVTKVYIISLCVEQIEEKTVALMLQTRNIRKMTRVPWGAVVQDQAS